MAVESNPGAADPQSGFSASRPAAALINRVLAGRYEILEMIGEGPLLSAFRARDRSLNRVVAVKTLLPGGAFSGQAATIQKLREGLGEVLSLSHPNITRAFDVGADEESGIPVFLAEEYVRGIDLKERIRRAAPFQLTAATDAAISLAEALEFAHIRGVAHGDVRPQNVLIGPEGQVKLSGFGVAEAQNATLYQDPALLRRVVAYIAPDAASSARPTPSADIYSLGVVLFEMLTGDLPFKGDNPVQVALKHAQEPIPSPRSVNTGVPRALEGVVMKALGKRPEERYASATEMLADLREIRNALRYGKSLAWSPLDANRADANRTLEMTAPVAAPAAAAPIIPSAPSAPTPPVRPPVAEDEDEDEDEPGNEGTIIMPGSIRGAAALEARRSNERRGNAASGTRSAKPAKPVKYTNDDDDDYGGNGRRRGGGGRWLTFINLFLLLLLIGAAGGLVYLTMHFVQPQNEVVVPNLVGKSLTDAKTQALDQKFELATVDEQYQDRIPADIIYQQRPAPGYHIREGKQVSIWVSKGPHMVDLPDVRDMGYDRAKRVIESNGLRVGEVTYEYDPIAAKGNVLRQSPQPGESRPRGTKVDLVLSKGEEPTPTPEPIPTLNPGDTGDTGATPSPDVPASPSDSGNPDDPDNKTRTFGVGYKVPDDGQPHHVRIDVIDKGGARTAYDQENQAGEKISTDITGVGAKITIKLYDNDVLKSEKTQ